MTKITKKKVEKKLLQVMDPELNISIIDLGLIYSIRINKNNKVKLHNTKSVERNPVPSRFSGTGTRVIITMTLTSMGCPLVSIIEQEIRDKLKEIGIKDKDIAIKLTFDPPWTMDKMSKRGKAMLGI